MKYLSWDRGGAVIALALTTPVLGSGFTYTFEVIAEAGSGSTIEFTTLGSASLSESGTVVFSAAVLPNEFTIYFDDIANRCRSASSR